MQLLRKKLEPDIETWAEQGRDAALAAGVEVGTGGTAAGREPDRHDDEDDDEEEEGYRPERDDDDEAGAGDPFSELWADIREACMARVGDYVVNEDTDLYTAEERAIGVEKVRTGLKRDLDEDSDEEDEDEDDEMDGAGATAQGAPSSAGPTLPNLDPEYCLWAATTGGYDLPANIERESQRKLKAAGKRAGPGR